MLKWQNRITLLIKSYFINSALLGGLTYKILPKKIIIRVPYFIDKNKELDFKALGTALHSIMPVVGKDLDIRFIRILYPYLDSSILTQYIAINAGKYNFNRMQKSLFKSVVLLKEDQEQNQAITGLKMELAGRLTTQRSIPRKTISNAQIGSFKSNSSTSQYTSKNKIGAFTIKISTSYDL